MDVHESQQQSGTAQRQRPLGTVRILDFTVGGAGPLLTKTLGDFGADIVKVESVEHIDFPRLLPPFADKIPGHNRSAYFTNRNSSKRSILLDLKNAEGIKVAKALAAKADVMVNSFRGGVLEGLGLGYAAVASGNPGVIHLSMPMMPTSGPSASHRGVGRTITGMTGIHNLTGYEDGEITGPGTHFPDHAVNPGHGLVAILASLYGRRKTGRGACIEQAQVHSTLQLLGPSLIAAAATGTDPRPVGNHPPHVVYAGALMAADGWYVVTIPTSGDLDRVGAMLKQSGARLGLLPAGEGRGPRLDAAGCAALADWSKTRPRRDCVAAFQGLGLAAAPIEDARTVTEAYPEMWQSGHLVRIPHPEMGEAVYNAPPIRRADGAEPALRRAPLIGEHTEEVLAHWLGMGADEIARLRQAGAFE